MGPPRPGDGAGRRDALELNIYYIPTDPELAATQVEEPYGDLVRLVKSKVRIPVAVKLSPYFTALANVALCMVQAGAGGLVLFNRFCQPELDLDTMEMSPHLSLSTPQELLLRLHWVAILYGQVGADLAVTGGVHSAQQVLKALMAGAKVTMMTSALLKHGIGHLTQVRDNVVRWMEGHGYTAIRQMQGSLSRRAVAEPNAADRANYQTMLRSYALRTPAGISPGC